MRKNTLFYFIKKLKCYTKEILSLTIALIMSTLAALVKRTAGGTSNNRVTLSRPEKGRLILKIKVRMITYLHINKLKKPKRMSSIQFVGCSFFCVFFLRESVFLYFS